jgi:hypothetical protein
MSEPPGELMGAGRRVGRLSDRKDEKTERKVNGKPAVRQTRKRPIPEFTAGRLVAVRFALTRHEWQLLRWSASLDGRWP